MSRPNLLQRWRERRRRQAVEALQEEVGVRLQRSSDREAWLTEELIPWLEGQLTPLLEQQTQIAHERSTWRFVIQMLIASHPAPELLLRNWTANLPNVVDELHDNLPDGDERLRQQALDAWKQELGHFTSLIERTVEARRAADRG